QLPAITNQLGNAPAAVSSRISTDGHREPTVEIEIAMVFFRSGVPPRICKLPSVRPVERRPMKLGFRRQSLTAPASVSARFGKAYVYRPTRHTRQRQNVEHRSIQPIIIPLDPASSMSFT